MFILVLVLSVFLLNPDGFLSLAYKAGAFIAAVIWTLCVFIYEVLRYLALCFVSFLIRVTNPAIYWIAKGLSDAGLLPPEKAQFVDPQPPNLSSIGDTVNYALEDLKNATDRFVSGISPHYTLLSTACLFVGLLILQKLKL